MTVAEILRENRDTLSNGDVANLAAWAQRQIKLVTGPRRKGYALIREGADLVLRARNLAPHEENP